MKRAYTLIELLVAITIILLVAAILFPVLGNAKRAGHRAESISNLRQTGVAIEMYRNDSDGELAYENLDLLVSLGYVKNKAILFSGVDDFSDGYGYEFSKCRDGDHPMIEKTTYETLLLGKTYFDWVKSIDPQAAIVVDRTHGQKFEQGTKDCRYIEFYYAGPILRLYEDTHVKQGNFSVGPMPGAPDSPIVFSRFRLFSELQDARVYETPLSTP